MINWPALRHSQWCNFLSHKINIDIWSASSNITQLPVIQPWNIKSSSCSHLSLQSPCFCECLEPRKIYLLYWPAHSQISHPYLFLARPSGQSPGMLQPGMAHTSGKETNQPFISKYNIGFGFSWNPFEGYSTLWGIYLGCWQFWQIFLRFLQLVAFQISSYYSTGSFRFASQFTLHYRVMLASVEYFQLILELKLNLGLTDVMA